ncbi:SMP-30/gluconolactonase/LRE family protein [Bradyrhizobium sp. 83002]|uniref:SMP-30/gluconolactonase/LRE family protein n=1 Tax=Bradyrhizobium aeschynomenes TaxID=2734909 RepID=UPI001554AA7F|nr:SMP-30/gluconolactonase/LRE family protein [Bradyrhizobium aeschynomenes]NPU12207.1 SMP-30/gluconolactonase/LRE family protein [Bradyrhizobium aeschynomenes]NPV24981.1 SMP-30/gluconolactonase/LRE family protein [Bradyrhizobium aeschynomenes]
MTTYDIRDPRFSALIIGHAKLEKLWTGCRWAEGPVYVPAAKSLLWSDIPNDRLMRFDETDGSVSVFETPCGYHNGHTRDALGRVIACEHGGRRISRLEHDGTWVGLVDRFEGKRFNSPNDAVVKSDGTIWFSDPTYGIDSAYEGHAAPSEIGASHVYRFDPATGAVAAVVTDMVKPNGLAFSADERLLYVADTGATHVPDWPAVIRVYAVAASGRTVGEGRVFATSPAGLFDGFRIDRSGNIWTSTGDAVAIYAPDGTLIGRIPVPEIVSNVTFGGPKRNRLYITAQTSLYAIFVNAHGIN